MYNDEIKRKLRHYFSQRFEMKKANPGWLLGTCPYCNKKLKFGLNVEKNWARCFVCGNFKPLKVIMEVEELATLNQALNFIKAFEEAETYLGSIKSEFEDLEIERVEGNVKLPEGFTILELGNNLVGQCARAFLRKRGFNIRNLSLRGIGYVDKPGSRYFGYIIIPYYVLGQLVYFTSRKIFDIGPKFKNPTLEEASIGKSCLIYNADALATYSEINIVESATNSLTLGPRTIGIGGKSISSHQKSDILRSPVKTINIFLDSDAYLEALQLAMDFSHHKKVRLIKMPDEKDVNDIGKKASLELKKKTQILDYHQYLKLKHNERSLHSYN